jgi:putative inorganic carbon (hco3(-)) transporter
VNLSAPAGRWRQFLGRQGTLSERGLRSAGSGLALVILALFLARASLERAATGLTVAIILVGTVIQPALGLAVLAFAIPFGSLIPLALPGVNVVDMLVGLTVVAWLTRGAARRQIVLRVPGLGWPILALAWVLGLSLLQANSWQLGLPEWFKWVEFAIVYLVAVQLLAAGNATDGLRSHAGWVLAGLFLAGIVEVGLGGYQFLRQVGPKEFILMGRFMRAYGTFNQPNPYAGYLGYLAPVAASLAIGGLGRWSTTRRTRDFWLFITCGAAALAFVAGIGMSWSRGAWLGLGAGLLAVIILRSRRYAPVIAAAVAVLVVALVLFGTAWLPNSVTRRLSDLGLYSADVDLAHVEVTDDNFAVLERLGHWQAGTAMFNDHPWLGVGVGNYGAAYPTYAPPHFYLPLGHAHNVYLNFLAETGILGGIAFGVIWMMAFWTAWRAARGGDGNYAALAVGVLGSLVYLSVHSLFDNLFVAHMQLQLALLLAILSRRSVGTASL